MKSWSIALVAGVALFIGIVWYRMKNVVTPLQSPAGSSFYKPVTGAKLAGGGGGGGGTNLGNLLSSLFGRGTVSSGGSKGASFSLGVNPTLGGGSFGGGTRTATPAVSPTPGSSSFNNFPSVDQGIAVPQGEAVTSEDISPSTFDYPSTELPIEAYNPGPTYTDVAAEPVLSTDEGNFGSSSGDNFDSFSP